MKPGDFPGVVEELEDLNFLHEGYEFPSSCLTDAQPSAPRDLTPEPFPPPATEEYCLIPDVHEAPENSRPACPDVPAAPLGPSSVADSDSFARVSPTVLLAPPSAHPPTAAWHPAPSRLPSAASDSPHFSPCASFSDKLPGTSSTVSESKAPSRAQPLTPADLELATNLANIIGCSMREKISHYLRNPAEARAAAARGSQHAKPLVPHLPDRGARAGAGKSRVSPLSSRFRLQGSGVEKRSAGPKSQGSTAMHPAPGAELVGYRASSAPGEPSRCLARSMMLRSPSCQESSEGQCPPPPPPGEESASPPASPGDGHRSGL